MGVLINSRKKNDSPSAENLVLGKLARHLCLQSTFLVYIYIYKYKYRVSIELRLRVSRSLRSLTNKAVKVSATAGVK